MKTAAIYHPVTARQERFRYPNCASRWQLLNKFVDLLLITAISIGTATSLLFLLALA